MPLTINTASTSNKLTTRLAVKTELGISSTSDDSLIDDLIQRASDRVERYCQRKFTLETVTETLPSVGSLMMVLERTPVNSITYVQFDGSSISATGYQIDNSDAGLIFKEDGWTNTRIYNEYLTLQNRRFGRRDWEIKYVAGYVLPTTSTGSTAARTLPYDVEKAAIELTKSYYFAREDDPNIFSEKTGDASQTKYNFSKDTLTGGDTLPPTAESLLRPWRRTEPLYA